MQRKTSLPKRKRTRFSRRQTWQSQSANQPSCMVMGTWQKNPTRRQLLNADRQEQIRREEQQHQEHVELMESFGQLQQQMSTWEADREAERREHARQIEEINKAREADKEELRREFLSMMQAANGQAPFQQVLVLSP